jgi:APA family basic amino acid/polyamine antiporter
LVVLVAINASLRTLEQLAEAFVLLLYPLLALTVAAVFVLRCTHPTLPRPYRTAGYSLVPAVFLIATVAMMRNALLERPETSLVSAGIMAAGVPVYFAWRRRSANA